MVNEIPGKFAGDLSRRVQRVLDLARVLIAMPTVTNCAVERLDEVHACAQFIANYLGDAGVEVPQT